MSTGKLKFILYKKRLIIFFFLEHLKSANETNPHSGTLEPSVLSEVLSSLVPLRATGSESVPEWDFVPFAQ
jgi:hypothetical protein